MPPLEPNTYGKAGKCLECKASVWRCRWNGLAIAFEIDLPAEIPAVGRGVGVMQWDAARGAWASHDDGRLGEVRLVHNCPGRPPEQPKAQASAKEKAGQQMSDPWDNPGSSAGVDFEQLKGSLLLITPTSTENVNTSFGEKECVRADIVVLDGNGAPVEHKDTLIFPKVLIGQVRSSIGTGKMILGRLGQGLAKPGQKPPWLLADPDDGDRKIARAWYESSKPSKLPF